jgi:hypothetical protein
LSARTSNYKKRTSTCKKKSCTKSDQQKHAKSSENSKRTRYSGAVTTTCTDIFESTSGLLSCADAADFTGWLEEIAGEACEIWQDIWRCSDSVRPDFALKDDGDYIWDQMFSKEGSLVFSNYQASTNSSRLLLAQQGRGKQKRAPLDRSCS